MRREGVKLGEVRQSVLVSTVPPALSAAGSERECGGSACAVIDLAAIRDNIGVLRAHAPTAQVMAVVKGDAYGHGLVPSARAAVAGGATWLGVAQPAEALALRAATPLGAGSGRPEPRILTWLYAPGAPLRDLLDADVDISISAPWALAETVHAARATGRTARIHLKVDTGLGRNGTPPADFPALLASSVAAQREGLVRVVGIWSHLAFADEPGHEVIRRQREVFDEAVRLAQAAGADLEVRHLANSAATLTDPTTHYDLVRPGLAVYGLSPVSGHSSPAAFGLVPAMTLQARLAAVKRVGPGHGVSYGHAYTTDRDTVLAVVPLGYADGIPRHASGGGPAGGVGGPVRVGDRVLRVAGRVCMDQFVLDLGPAATAQAGDTVTLFGPGAGLDAGGPPTAEDWAAAAGTISYEIVTRLGPRVPRVYRGTGAATEPSPRTTTAEEPTPCP